MGAEADVAVVREVIDAFERRDVDAVLALADPDIEFHAVTGELLGREEPYRGHAGIRAYFADEAGLWDELRITLSEARRHNGAIVATGRVWARSGARLVDDSAGWIWRVKEGRITYGQVFRTAAAAQQAAGLA